jgi:hypothetical protein
MSTVLSHPVFRDAAADMESQGIRVTSAPVAGSKTYAVVGGRSSARWWLVPLQNGRVAASGLALFQPLLASARLQKCAALVLSLLGLGRFWAQECVYISGEPKFGRLFPGAPSHCYSWFTGTDSPHRKVAVQIMDINGGVLGFGKLTRSPAVGALLLREAAVLQRVRALGLKSAYVPSTLYVGPHEKGILLVTDTRKTMLTRSTTRFTATHRCFLHEMAVATAAGPRLLGAIADAFASRIANVRTRLSGDWARRLDAGVVLLRKQAHLRVPVALSHGDFTPWNTFVSRGRLYVFDWEYAEEDTPVSNDLIHFVLNQPCTRRLRAEQKLASAATSITQSWTGIRGDIATAMVVCYLLTQCLRQIEREPDCSPLSGGWDGAAEQAQLLDILIDTPAVP